MKFGQTLEVHNIDFKLPPVSSFTKEVLKSYKPIATPKVYIGGSVWSDPVYKGTMYPSNTKIKDFLGAYSQQFNTVEVNATRYGVPKLSTMEKWSDTVPNYFKFSFKVPQVISHRKNINDVTASDKLNDFLSGLDAMGDKAGMSFFLGASYNDISKLNDYLTFIQQYPEEFPLCFELRNSELQNNHELLKSLAKSDKALAITDTPGEREVLHMNLSNATLYVRFLGCIGDASDQLRIDQWIERIEELVDLGLQEVYFMIHQPAPKKYLTADLTRYMVKQLKTKYTDLKAISPIDYSQATLF